MGGSPFAQGGVHPYSGCLNWGIPTIDLTSYQLSLVIQRTKLLRIRRLYGLRSVVSFLGEPIQLNQMLGAEAFRPYRRESSRVCEVYDARPRVCSGSDCGNSQHYARPARAIL